MATANEHVHPLELRGGCGFRRRLFAISLIESINASRGINQLLFAGKERVTRGTDFHVQIALLGRARLERLAASAGNIYFDVFCVNSWFHLRHFL